MQTVQCSPFYVTFSGQPFDIKLSCMAVSDLKYLFTSEKLFSLSDKEIMLKTETLIFFVYLGVKDIQVHDILKFIN